MAVRLYTLVVYAADTLLARLSLRML
jgi:hypothetical protein